MRPLPLAHAEPAEKLLDGGVSGREGEDERHGARRAPAEEFAEEMPHLDDGAAELGAEVLRRHARKRAPRDPLGDEAELPLARGEGVRADVAAHLEPVLHGPHEPVGAREGLLDLRPEKPEVGEPFERLEGVARSRVGAAPPVDELHRLRDELYIADAARHELYVRFALRRRKAGHGAFPHREDGGERVPRGGGSEDRPRAVVEKGLRDAAVSSGVAGLDEGLPLPRARAPLEVREVLAKGDDERAALSVGTEPQVDAVERALLGRLGQDLDDAPRERRVEDLLPGRAGGIAHEEEIDVRGIVELRAAELAERDHREAPERRLAVEASSGREPLPRREIGEGEGNGRLDDRVGEERELGRHLLDGGEAEKIARADAEDLAAVVPLDGVQAPARIAKRRGLRLELRPVFAVSLAARERRPLDEPREVPGIPREDVGEEGAAGEYRRRETGDRPLEDERVEERPRRDRRLDESHEVEEREVRVRRRGYLLEEARDPVGVRRRRVARAIEAAPQSGRLRRVGEAELREERLERRLIRRARSIVESAGVVRHELFMEPRIRFLYPCAVTPTTAEPYHRGCGRASVM